MASLKVKVKNKTKQNNNFETCSTDVSQPSIVNTPIEAIAYTGT